MNFRIRIRNQVEVLCWTSIISSISVVSTHAYFKLSVPAEDYARLNGHPLIIALILGAVLGYFGCWQIMVGQNNHIELRRTTDRDSLTGVLSRARFFERAKDVPLGDASLIMLDVDHFKSVNDTHGHQCGDMVLAEVGRILREGCRQSDLVARYGGEEFVVLVPTGGINLARELAERLRASVERSPIEYGGGALSVSISLGIAAGGARETVDGMIARADRALLTAKSRGRNQVVSELHTAVPEPVRSKRLVPRV